VSDGAIEPASKTHREPSSRTPPADVRRLLREEVAFGCPVRDCGSPYLTWHHFDPPWSVREHHDPAGMVALCLDHHKEADVGTFTAEQLRELKTSPYLARVDELPHGRFNWRRDQLVMLAGGNWYVGCSVLLSAHGTDLIWLTKDEAGNEALNLDLHDAKGRLLLQMRTNDWLVHAPFADLQCPPARNSLLLKARAEGVRLAVKFSRATTGDIRDLVGRLTERGTRVMLRSLKARHQDTISSGAAPAWWIENERRMMDEIGNRADERAAEMFEFLREHLHGDEITLCRLSGRFVYPVDARLQEDKTVLPGNNVLMGNMIIVVGIGVSLG
jgi:hypothetical protein